MAAAKQVTFEEEEESVYDIDPGLLASHLAEQPGQVDPDNHTIVAAWASGNEALKPKAQQLLLLKQAGHFLTQQCPTVVPTLHEFSAVFATMVYQGNPVIIMV